MNSLWVVLGSLAAFSVAYRFYGAFLAARVAVLNDAAATPAHRRNDGVDYHPTNRWVLFGHHFAAIAGPGPLIGPVLAAQWGYFPGLVWIVIGACLAGAVHDFVILVASVRSEGLSLPRLARNTIGKTAGITASVATLFIIVCTLASVAIVVVKALAESSWGMFTIIVTIPAALVTGAWMYKIRPGRVAEASALGVTLVLLGVFLGRPFAESAWGDSLILSASTLKWLLPAYALVASVLPVWVLMCPRDYLSSYMKIGVMVVLGVGLVVAAPDLRMPATTPFISGGGPVISGAVWPYICIVIMCGAISGFHALIASGTTPKMLDRERDIRPIGYGAMVLEGFVAVTALVAATALYPGDYFAINIAQDTPTQQSAYAAFVDTHTASGWDVAPRDLATLEAETHESLRGRTGGAVTLAVGMAEVFSSLPGMKALTSYWYHFVIMFEALFILTLLETGTRVARFVFQEAVDQFSSAPRGRASPDRAGPHADSLPAHPIDPLAGSATVAATAGLPNDAGSALHPKSKARPNWAMNFAMSVIVCAGWGYLLSRGDLDSLWSMLGIANQLLACIALAVGTTYLLLHAPKRVYALCTGVPFVFVVVTTFSAGIGRVAGWIEKARSPALNPDQVFYTRLTATLAVLMLIMTVVIVAATLVRWARLATDARSARTRTAPSHAPIV